MPGLYDVKDRQLRAVDEMHRGIAQEAVGAFRQRLELRRDHDGRHGYGRRERAVVVQVAVDVGLLGAERAQVAPGGVDQEIDVEGRRQERVVAVTVSNDTALEPGISSALLD